MRWKLDVNGRAVLPAEQFLRTGGGRVLDIGAGTGRSTLMVPEARPQATVVAFDLFGDSYEQHFGTDSGGPERLMANLRAAGAAERGQVQAGDMRQLPFAAASFEGVVSAYAIDHLNRAGGEQALREAAPVLKPGGDFLMMVIDKDAWLRFTFGPLLLHSGTRGREWWTGRIQAAGLTVVEAGSQPATLYVLARKP